MNKLAFVGLGAMGLPMAINLARKQFPVIGYDLRPKAVATLEAEGGRGAGTLGDAVSGADVLILMVVSAEQAEQVLFEAGALDSLAAGATVVLMATCAAARVAAMAERVAASGRAFIDAPVSGGVVGATAGTLTIMAAAPKAIFERSKDLLLTMGSNLFHVGEKPGQGAALKTVNQLLCGLHIAVAAEGLALAERAGIDPQLALEILSGSAASSWMLKDRGPRMIASGEEVKSAVDIFVKDLGIVLDSGRAAKMGLPLAAVAHQLFVAASGLGLGARDDSQVIEVYRALNAANGRKAG
jgi:3-hydroxyisobutyrate dehydrogenase